MKEKMPKSKKRAVASLIISLLLVIYFFNFVPRNASIIASRSLARQIADYCLNIAIFFIVIYLFLSLMAYLRNKIFSKKPN